MKKTYIVLAAVFVVLLSASCTKDESASDFTLDTRELALGAEGGTKEVRLTIAGRWTATANEPWVQISPSNGNGPMTCQIKADSSLLADEVRTAIVRFTAQDTKDAQTVSVAQQGFEKALTLSETTVALENYAAYGKRYFDVTVTSNVAFEVEIPEQAASWLSYEKYHFELDRGARPRTTKIRFNWEGNSEMQHRTAKISFNTEASDLVRHDAIAITQDRAPEITPDRAGDSLALVVIERKLGAFAPWNKSEPMLHWRGVSLWEETDEGCTPEKEGRVRAVEFNSFYTKEGIPDEIKHLTCLETLSFFSNGSKHLFSFDAGTAITELVELKHLRIYSFGLTSLPAEFARLKKLETLDLSGNNLNEVPAVLTPENFPKLKHLSLVNNKRSEYTDLTLATRPKEEWGGLYHGTNTLERLLRWDNLESLLLSNNFIRGGLPKMDDYTKYTQEEVMQNDTLRTAASVLVGSPKVLPKCKDLRIGLNYLRGEVPQWVLIHPRLMRWQPEISIFGQQRAYDDNGILPGFTNLPKTYDYYWDLYPLLKPEY